MPMTPGTNNINYILNHGAQKCNIAPKSKQSNYPYPFLPCAYSKLIEPHNCLYTDIKGWKCSISFSAKLISSLKAMTENQGLRDMEKLPCLIPFAHR